MTLAARIHEDEVPDQEIIYSQRNVEDVGNRSTEKLVDTCQASRCQTATGLRFSSMHFVSLPHDLIYRMALGNNSQNIKCVRFHTKL
jgi:hypothetical protein